MAPAAWFGRIEWVITMTGSSLDIDVDGIEQAVHTGSLPGWQRVERDVVDAYERYGSRSSGIVADYIPGPVEVTVGDRAPLVFDAGPDGEELVCREGPWIDPFADVGTGADPESEAENARYIAEYGKWAVFDPDEGSDVSALVDHKIQALAVDTVTAAQ